MTAEEFLKQVSPNDKFGIRADLKAGKIEKHVIDIMERYAALRIHDVSGECEHPWASVMGDGEMKPAKCLKCGKYL